MTSDDDIQRSLTASISRSIVGIYKDHVGRGPTKAHTSINNGHVVVVLEDGLTKAEQKLMASGRRVVVRNIRREFQETMRDDIVSVVEEHTGRRVKCLLSDHSPDPDYAVEVLLFDDGQPADQTPVGLQRISPRLEAGSRRTTAFSASSLAEDVRAAIRYCETAAAGSAPSGMGSDRPKRSTRRPSSSGADAVRPNLDGPKSATVRHRAG